MRVLQRRRATPPTIFLALRWVLWHSLLLLFLCWGSTEAALRTNNQRRLVTTLSNNEPRFLSENDATRARVIFDEFNILLSTTPFELDRVQYDQLRGVLQQLLQSRVGSTIDAFAGLSLEYILITQVSGNFANETTTLTVGEGVASFRDPNGVAPTTTDMNLLVRRIITDDLDATLSETQFYFVSQTTYIPPGEVVEDAAVSEEEVPIVEAIQGPVPSDSSGSSGSGKLGLASGVGVASFAAVALVTLLVARSSRKVCVPGYDLKSDENGRFRGGKDGEGISPDAETQREISQVAAATLAVTRAGVEYDNRSMADSDSSWTVSTEAGDSAALKSIQHLSAANTAMWQGLSMVSSESFEYDRPINIQKDMLTSSWSGRLSTHHGPQHDSVLKPSHFSAQQERRQRRKESLGSLEPDSTMPPRRPPPVPPPEEVDEKPSDAAPPIFRPHSELGEEVFLMPARSSSSRMKRIV